MSTHKVGGVACVTEIFFLQYIFANANALAMPPDMAVTSRGEKLLEPCLAESC